MPAEKLVFLIKDPRMCGLFKNQQTFRYNLGYCKLYDVVMSEVSTKMQLVASSTSKYDFLITAKHPNLLPVLKTTKHSVYTRHIIPFSEVYSKDKQEYNRYAMIKIAEAVTYLHTELHIEHHGIEMDALFVNDNGIICLGKFNRKCEYTNGTVDRVLLDRLSNELTGMFVDQLGEPAMIFQLLEQYPLLKENEISEKKSMVPEILKDKDLLPLIMHKKIIEMFLEDVRHSKDTNYKIFLLESMFSFDRDLLNTDFSKELFSILNSTVRLYLLRNIGFISDINKCAAEVCLGLTVKDKTMRLETVNFVFAHYSSIVPEILASIFGVMQNVSDSEMIGMICHKLTEAEKKSDASLAGSESAIEDPICSRMLYKLLLKYATLGKSRLLVYNCIEQYFVYFDKYKLSKELLPLLCSKLCDKESQDECFSLVRRILIFLRQNRNEIQRKDWSLKNLKGMLGIKKDESGDAVQKKITKIEESELRMWSDEDVIE